MFDALNMGMDSQQFDFDEGGVTDAGFEPEDR
jgi:hypothetical protein